MTRTRYYSLTELARKLGLPESTVRYYRDRYSRHLPVVGRGRKRLYTQETLERLTRIKAAYAAGKRHGEIVVELKDLNGSPDAAGSTAIAKYDDAVAALVEGERERRETMWQMAREIGRLGEAIERLNIVVGAVAQHVGNVERVLPRRATGEGRVDDGIPIVEASAIDVDVAGELEELRRQLDAERELVERLRKSKVRMERRAAAAEARVDEEPGRSGIRSLVDRLLSRDPPPE